MKLLMQNIGIKVGNPGADIVEEHLDRKPNLSSKKKAKKQNDECSC